MAIFTNYSQEKLLGYLLGDTAISMPVTWYFGLSTTTPTYAGGNVTEPSGNAYARVAVTNNTTNFPAPSGSSSGATSENGTSITWPQATGSWGTITYVVLFDASTSGNLWAYWELSVSQTIASGAIPTISTSNLSSVLN